MCACVCVRVYVCELVCVNVGMCVAEYEVYRVCAKYCTHI